MSNIKSEKDEHNEAEINLKQSDQIQLQETALDVNPYTYLK